MAKSDQMTILSRVQDVTKLLLAGAAHEDIRQFAEAHNWQVSERQLRRYQKQAYEQLAQEAKRDQTQLMGRHLMQRRALYARAMKTSDIRTALWVLKDEAALQGLYEVNKESGLPSSPKTTLSRRERLRRLLAARRANDRQGVELVETSSPKSVYIMPDTRMSEMMIAILGTLHATEQLERAAMIFLSLFRMVAEDPPAPHWYKLATHYGWCYKVGHEAWNRFGEDVGFDAQQTLADAHIGVFLETFHDQIMRVCPSQDEAECILCGGDAALHPDGLGSIDAVVRDWHRQLDEVLDK